MASKDQFSCIGSHQTKMEMSAALVVLDCTSSLFHISDNWQNIILYYYKSIGTCFPSSCEPKMALSFWRTSSIISYRVPKVNLHYGTWSYSRPWDHSLQEAKKLWVNVLGAGEVLMNDYCCNKHSHVNHYNASDPQERQSLPQMNSQKNWKTLPLI